MANDFEPGDIVQLKSGGPAMTAMRFDHERGQLWCEWFDAKGELKKSPFFPAVLEAVDYDE